jgi:hypothetical protein
LGAVCSRSYGGRCVSRPQNVIAGERSSSTSSDSALDRVYTSGILQLDLQGNLRIVDVVVVAQFFDAVPRHIFQKSYNVLSQPQAAILPWSRYPILVS